MSVFYVLLFVPILIQHITIKGHYLDHKKRNHAALAVFFLGLTVLVMFRHENVGTDTKNYIHYFKHYRWLDWDSLFRAEQEPGFVAFSKIVSLFTDDPQVFLAVAAIVTVALIYPTYKRLCVDTALTVALFCTMSTFVMMFSGVRQMLAIGIGFIAYDCTRHKRLIPFIVLVLLTTMIHSSAFMLLFMYPLYHAKITKKSLYIVAPILAVCFLFNQQIFGTLTLILKQYTRFEAEISSTGAYTMLVLFAMFTVFSFLIPDEKKLDEETIGLRNFLLMTLALQMFAPLHMVAMRMGYYYIIYVPLLLPRIIACRSRRWNQVAILARHVMVVFFLFYFFASASGREKLDVFPYHFVWESIG